MIRLGRSTILWRVGPRPAGGDAALTLDRGIPSTDRQAERSDTPSACPRHHPRGRVVERTVIFAGQPDRARCVSLDGPARPRKPERPDSSRKTSSSSSEPIRDPTLALGMVGNLVDHQPARRPQSVAPARLNQQPKQRGLGRVSGEGADGDRGGGVETVILENDHWPGFAGVVLAARDGPDLASLHPAKRSEIASTKS